VSTPFNPASFPIPLGLAFSFFPDHFSGGHPGPQATLLPRLHAILQMLSNETFITFRVRA
jgi:hypothetical protein